MSFCVMSDVYCASLTERDSCVLLNAIPAASHEDKNRELCE